MNNISAFELDAMDTTIKELVAYARERGGEDRSALFRNLIDLFLTGKAPQKQPTRKQLIDVIEALIPHVEADTRRTVAELLARMSTPPFDLAVCLAKDDPDVVRDLLTLVTFDETDIIELISKTGRDHHQAIASRQDLSANVWIALARAAPKANTTQKKPSLSLWSEDLGTQKTPEKTTATVTTIRPRHQISAEQIEWGNDAASQAATKSAETTEVPERQVASLRILRTNKDLISGRVENTKGNRFSGSDEQIDNTQLTTDALPNTWTWRSDRDGIVSGTSLGQTQQLALAQPPVGANVLDLLALNTKLGHPVSRAFQRRSAIHDAPITLDGKNEADRYWTLEATPLFNGQSGVFEGYTGTLSRVIAAEKKDYTLAGGSDENLTVFLDDPSNDTPTDTPLMTDENIDRTRTPAPASLQTVNSEEIAKAPSSLIDEKMVAETATSAIKNVLAETLSSMLQSAEGQTEAKPEDNPEPIDSAPISEMKATLQLLEEAVAKLTNNESADGGIASRLQVEIAAACIRSLKEQLDKKSN